MICPTCGVIFKDQVSFRRHVNSHDNEEAKNNCDFCDYVGNSKNLYQHKINAHAQRSRFFAIKDSKLKLYYTFLEYENFIYVDKKMFNKTKI